MTVENSVLTKFENDLLGLRHCIGDTAPGAESMGKLDSSVPLSVQIHAAPLVALAESAAVGFRLYEFLLIKRPGDVLRYLWADLTGTEQAVVDRVRSSVKYQRRWAFDEREPFSGVPFIHFDRAFWNQESDWLDEDMSDLARAWIGHRSRPLWTQLATDLLRVVSAIQARLRTKADPLLQHEISMIDSGTHRRSYWARVELAGRLTEPPTDITTLDPGLLELITSIARRDDVKSVSCSLVDYALWRALANVQFDRSKMLGVEPSKALFLAGPDSGIPNVVPADWGCRIHIPYEGVCEADLFEIPPWFQFHHEEALIGGTVRAGLGRRDCRFVLSRKNLGEYPGDEAIACGTWTLYRPRKGAENGLVRDPSK